MPGRLEMETMTRKEMMTAAAAYINELEEAAAYHEKKADRYYDRAVSAKDGRTAQRWSDAQKRNEDMASDARRKRSACVGMLTAMGFHVAWDWANDDDLQCVYTITEK